VSIIIYDACRSGHLAVHLLVSFEKQQQHTTADSSTISRHRSELTADLKL